MIKIARFTFNPLGENTYLLIADGGECLIVDAGCCNEAEQKTLASYIAEHKLSPVMSVLTHAHPDHAVGAAWAKEYYNIPLALHSADNDLLAQVHLHGLMFGFAIDPMKADIDLAEQQNIEFGGESVEVIHTPGHSQGCVCLYIPAQGVLLSGDTLFAGSIGRTDLPGGDYDKLMNSIVERVLPLGGGVRVLPGHGRETTIAQELNTNPFITEVLDGGFNKPYEG